MLHHRREELDDDDDPIEWSLPKLPRSSHSMAGARKVAWAPWYRGQRESLARR